MFFFGKFRENLKQNVSLWEKYLIVFLKKQLLNKHLRMLFKVYQLRYIAYLATSDCKRETTN